MCADLAGLQQRIRQAADALLRLPSGTDVAVPLDERAKQVERRTSAREALGAVHGWVLMASSTAGDARERALQHAVEALTELERLVTP